MCMYDRDALLSPFQKVEKYRADIENRGQMQFKGAARKTALIARAARISKGGRERVCVCVFACVCKRVRVCVYEGERKREK